jgi:aryl-alcohol dehydrogenase-like predicted oxidoreductase
VASSPNFSLGVQQVSPWPDCVSLSGPDHVANRQWYLDNPVSLFTWSSLAGGFFSGRFRRDNLESFSQAYDQLCVRVYCHEENFQRLDRVDELANEKGIDIPQLALAYVLNQPQGIHALVGSRTPDEVAVNIAASEVDLTAKELDWLDLRN